MGEHNEYLIADEPTTGLAASGSLLAVATLECKAKAWTLLKDRTRLFHLGDRSQSGIRRMASQLHEFLVNEGVDGAAFCRTGTGYGQDGLDDEIRIEALLQMIPGLDVAAFDNETIREWSIRTNPAFPENLDESWRGLIQIRSIEIAQFRVWSSQYSLI